MSKLISFTVVAGLLSIFFQAEANAGYGSSGWGGVPVWQTPENEPGAQARREQAQLQPMQPYGTMRHYHHHHYHYHHHHHAM